MSGYFDCACCGTTDIGEDDETLCDACVLCGCGEEGDDPSCKELLLDGSHGIYVPQQFAKHFDPKAWGVSEENIAILLAGPDHAQYWDAWDAVCGRVERDANGKRWVLTQDGDLWAECVGKAANLEGKE